MTVKLVAGQASHVTLRLRRKGTEELTQGEWDSLAGVLFGCSRKGCAMPETDKKVAALTKRFRESRNQRDPQLLAEAYTLAADVLANSGDHDESSKWRARAAAQTTKALTLEK
ncbi:MAG: hypothetical protein ACOYOU_10640 [Kiritimatiellia bacterium]